MASELPQQAIEKFRECFNYYDFDHVGTVPMNQLPLVIQSLEFYPTHLELKEISHQYKKQGAVNFPEFLEIMASLVHRNINSEILDAFQAYDEKGTGLIHVNDLKRILQTTGQKLSTQDVNQAIEMAGTGTGDTIRYREFVRKLLQATKNVQNGPVKSTKRR